MGDMKITLEESLLLMAKHPHVLSVLAEGNRYSTTVVSVRHKLPYANEIYVCSEGTWPFRVNHALMIITGKLTWYVETDRKAIRDFWKQIKLN